MQYYTIAWAAADLMSIEPHLQNYYIIMDQCALEIVAASNMIYSFSMVYDQVINSQHSGKVHFDHLSLTVSGRSLLIDHICIKT